MFDLEDAKKRGVTCGTLKGRIVADNVRSEYPLLVLLDNGEREFTHQFKLDGTSPHACDLVNLPREVTVWAGRSDGGHAWYMDNEDDARAMKEAHQAQGRAAGYAPVTIKLTR